MARVHGSERRASADPGSDLGDLARQALETPALEASSAMDVLVDALLEAGVLDGATIAVPTGADQAKGALRRRAFLWARGRLAPDPSPLERIVAIVDGALAGRGLPPPIVGAVRPNVLRLRFLVALGGADVAREVEETVRAALPNAIVVEVVQGPR